MKSLIGLLIALVAGVSFAAETEIAVPVAAPALPSVRGMEFDTFIRLQRGMTEGELLVRAGRPDYESVDNLHDYDRTLYYFPTVANPYTTVVKLRSGRIAHIERVKKF